MKVNWRDEWWVGQWAIAEVNSRFFTFWGFVAVLLVSLGLSVFIQSPAALAGWLFVCFVVGWSLCVAGTYFLGRGLSDIALDD